MPKTQTVSNRNEAVERPEVRVTTDALPRISQKLKLECQACGKRSTYDVGRIYYHMEGEGKSAKARYAFANYFRCRDCGSAGPWEMADLPKLLGLTLRAKLIHGDDRIVAARCALFDGTLIQTPAQGEDYLRGLIDQDPQNAFLHTRLGNLLRGCGERTRAIEWYTKALARDAGDVEARHHLFSFAAEDPDCAGAITHASLLVRHILEGRQTQPDELTEGIALHVADNLRSAPPEFRAEFLGKAGAAAEPPERTFIRTLLEQTGDEDAIVMDAADRLLAGQARPSGPPKWRVEASPNDEADESQPDLAPSLREVVEKEGLNESKLSVALEANGQGQIRVKDRHSISVYDGKKFADWQVPSLRELFRGTRPPPADMDRYPEEYCGHFYFIEGHLLTACQAQGDRTDQEMEEIYGMLRRRPDGRSLGPTHDFLWQVAALRLGMHVLSQAEFEAIIGRLERSVRNWALRPISRFYVQYLRENLSSV